MGTNPLIPTRSAFYDSDMKETGLQGFLKYHKVTEVVFIGINHEQSIQNSIMDAMDFDYQIGLVKHGILGY